MPLCKGSSNTIDRVKNFFLRFAILHVTLKLMPPIKVTHELVLREQISAALHFKRTVHSDSLAITVLHQSIWCNRAFGTAPTGAVLSAGSLKSRAALY